MLLPAIVLYMQGDIPVVSLHKGPKIVCWVHLEYLNPIIKTLLFLVMVFAIGFRE